MPLSHRIARLPVLVLAVSLLGAALPLGCQPAVPDGGGLLLLPDESPLPPGTETRDERLNYHDFGRVSDGDVVQHVFRLRNSDPRPVAIKRLIPGCGCTVAALRTVHADGSVERGEPITSKADSLLTVLPGELAEIEVRISTRDMQTKNTDKLIVMSVETDSENGYYISLEVHIYVDKPFEVVPGAIVLGRIPENGGGEGKVEIVQAGQYRHQLRELGPLPSGVHAELGVETRNGLPLWTLRAGFDPPLTSGPLRSALLITSEDHQGAPGRSIEVPLTAQVVPDIQAEPERLVFAGPTGRAAAELHSLLAGQRLRVTGVEVPEAARSFLAADFAPVEADSSGTSQRWRITLAARAPLPEQDLITGQLVVRLDDPQHPSVALDYVIHPR